MAGKEMLKTHIIQQSEQLAVEASTRSALEEDLALILQDGVVQVVYRLIESEEY